MVLFLYETVKMAGNITCNWKLYMKDSQHKRMIKILSILRNETKKFTLPAADQIIKEYGKDPFLILISCLLSLRTRDVTSVKISRQLFRRARTPKALIAIPQQELEVMLRPIGFYRRKAAIIKHVSNELLTRFGGRVPSNSEDLLSIKGIGQKTANLVLGYAYGIPAICVDTHVHRLSNRLGLVKTKTPDQTEKALQQIVAKKNWIELNHLFVLWGQNICTPVVPICSKCSLFYLCPRIGVKKSR